MKKLLLTITLVITLLVTACNPFSGRRHSLMSFSSSDKEQKIVVNSDNLSLEIIYSGEMEFNDDETAIKKMSPGGYLEYRKNGAKLLAETDSRGEIYYEFYNDGLPLDRDINGRKFLVLAIQDMIAYGVNVKGRVDRLYQQGGIPLVLEEAEKLKTDYVKKKYFEYMLRCDSVLPEEMTDIALKIETSIGSDNEKRQLLEKFPADYLSDTLTAQAYFLAVKSISSDYDKANTLKKIQQQQLSNQSIALVLQAASTINSDNDKANLLNDMIKKGTYPAENVDGLLDVTATVNSEYEKAGVLKTLMEKVTIKREDFNKLLDVIGKISADNDKSNVLKILIKNQPFENEHFAKLLAVTSKINSDYEKADVFKKLAEQPIRLEENWVSLINEIPTISSDNDKANVLLQIARKMPRSEIIKSAYLSVSKTISSEHDYARTVKDVQ
ncbi:MAG: hypothetical protein ABIN89_14610 [Chitinophagaceae bacterium]